jgi:23S rRNA (uracil1939-C5)-methyltransferase
VAPEPDELEIVRLGAQGDGVALSSGGPATFVPFALPGERVRVVDGQLPEIVRHPSPDRQPAVCPHFGLCGGCVAQHMSATLYADWKRGIVVEAFRQRGLEPEIGPLVAVPVNSRRRALLSAKRIAGKVVLGYHRRRSHDLFPLEHCSVLLPEIVAALPTLRAVADTLGWEEARFSVLASDVGLDVAVTGAGRRVEARAGATLARLSAQHRVARLTIAGEIILEQAAPTIESSGIQISPPSGAFLQAVAEAEAAMVGAVLAQAGKPKRAADLFCGIGTFALALARTCRVTALDSDKASLGALEAAVRRAQGLKPIEARVRDLFREPLSALELAPFDLVVLDPPRAGAKAQCEALAASKVRRVIYVSCDPATLARDASILVDAGFRLGEVTPIDQFVYSAHVEAVVAFSR